MDKDQSVKVKMPGPSWIAAKVKRVNSGGSVCVVLEQDWKAYRKGDEVTVARYDCQAMETRHSI